MLFSSYRARLIFYILLLVNFMSGTLIYSYSHVHGVLLDEADNHLVRLKQLFSSHLNSEHNELQRYATIVAHDLRVKEYMYVVTSIGGDSQPLNILYNREFGWLPIDRKMILDNTNKILVGKDHADLARAVKQYINKNPNGIFYFQGQQGLEVVAISPIIYRGTMLGRVIVSKHLNQQWLTANKKITHGEFFLVKNNKIIMTTLEKARENISGENMSGENTPVKFSFSHNSLSINSDKYRIYQIDLPGNNTEKAELWFGLSEKEIISKLASHRQTMLVLVVAAITSILLVGLVIIRSFSRPLNQLIQATRQVAAGELPDIGKGKVTNEFDELSNNFADMLVALRYKQEEIELAHERLEQSAIPDSLTGLYNRRYLMETFPKLLAQAKREDLSVFATLLDLDHFKKINDSHGHMAGDHCLVAFADQLQHESRTSDYLFRVGGEEFLILSVHKNIMDALNFADKLRIIVENRPIHVEDILINITVSGGVSSASSGGNAETALKQMLSRADLALYQAKNAGRNRVCLSSTPDNTGTKKPHTK